MSQYAKPFLIVNIQCEVIFIIHMRLHDQKIGRERINLIMQDLVSIAFDKDSVETLLNDRFFCGNKDVENAFSLLKECSMIRLSRQSINKLQDIVIMTVKYQLYTLGHPLELVEMTFNHLQEVKQLIPYAAAEYLLILENLFRSFCCTFSAGQLAEIRQCLLNLLLGRRSRISFFLDSGFQLPDGSFRILSKEYISPAVNTEAPGVIRSFTEQEQNLAWQEHFYHPKAFVPLPTHIAVGSWVPSQMTLRMTKNGTNMFKRHFGGPSSSALCENLRVALSLPSFPESRDSRDDVDGGALLSGYTNQINTLATLLRGTQKSSSAEGRSPGFKRNIPSHVCDGQCEDIEHQAKEGVLDGLYPKIPHPCVLPSDLPEARVAMSKHGVPSTILIRRENQQLLGIISSFNDGEVGVEKEGLTKQAAEKDFLDIMDDP